MPTRLVRSLYNIQPSEQGGVITIGNFDGVHLGHQQLLEKLVQEAKKRNVPAVVVTFEPHPFEFFERGKHTIPRITRLREKYRALSGYGIDAVIIIPFNQYLASLSASSFVRDILHHYLRPVHILIGDDFRFGHKRQGDVQLLKEMEKQRDRSRQSSQFTAEVTIAANADTPPTEFTGHKNLLIEKTIETGKILALYRDGKFVESLAAGEKGSIVLDKTPFYAESGGQVGDHGLLVIPNKAMFKVFDTIKQGHMHLHLGKLEKGALSVGETVNAEVDAKRRAAIVLNHTATHILHMVLKQVLGEHALQKGSLVEPERLRFDYTHAAPLSTDELRKIEQLVNNEIRANHLSSVRESTLEEAVANGAVALFGEKYGNKVRVVSFGQSVELCGGTHAEHTGDIGIFKITAETGVAAGIRRIEAVTGEGALRFIEKREDEFKQKINQAETRALTLEKEIQQLQDKLAEIFSGHLANHAKTFGNTKVLATRVEGLDGKSLRSAIDHLKKQLGSAVIILATVKEKKVGIVGGVTDDLVNKLSAKELVNKVAIQVGGKGGGRADLAEAGGNQPEALEKALESIYTDLKDTLTK